MKILLHQCCGPCSIYPIEVLMKESFEITTFFYNPNIHPMHEFYMRLNGAIDVAKYYNINILISEDYGLEKFLKSEFYDSDKRCNYCYEIRIKMASEVAKSKGFDFFTTSLLYSKYQNHENIVALCEKYAKEYGVEFYYNDFRDGWKFGIDKSKEMEIYRQQYCGCIFSEIDRYNRQLGNKLAKRISSEEIVEVI